MSVSLETGSERLEAELWKNVQRTYRNARSYRAGDNPEYAKALAAWERVAFPSDPPSNVPSNVLPFTRAGQRK